MKKIFLVVIATLMAVTSVNAQSDGPRHEVGVSYGVGASAIIDVMVSIVLMRLRYGFRHSAVAIRMLVTMLMLAIACFAAAFLSDAWVSYGVMSATTAVCMVYSFVQLNSRLDIRSIINRFTKGRNSEEKA